MHFSEKLLYLRNRENMSQEDLANRLNVSRQSISKWEVGDSIPEIMNIIEISKIFNVSVDCLVKDDLSISNDDSIEKIVIDFLNASKNMDRISDDLIEIAKDGIVDSDEKKQLADIILTLDRMSAIVEELKLRVVD